ncbi:hypothetical protein JCGZ_17366 [Jatropha curcas]|uniref:Uncharacterized protein n=1 Tax=Jatropha curcas TaxID=180498 RepID=A0A067LMX0_JATCU|nr:cation/H(+) symporter 13 [Jatropha curcas]KDP45759.1 hypothetical protein JCGZ_17366 [Jatropha curcas]
MENSGRVIVTIGTVSGPFFKESMVCQYKDMIRPTRGIFLGDNPFDFTFPILLLQISLIFLTTRFIYLFLKPLRQSILTAEVLAGILLGPSFLWHYCPALVRIFPPGGRIILNIIAQMGLILHIFILSLQMNTNIIKHAGASEALIGITGFLLPAIIGWLTFKTFMQINGVDERVTRSVLMIIMLHSLSSFPVINSLLIDLKILNSDLGRFASKICMINDISCFVVSELASTGSTFARESFEMALSYMICVSMFLLAVVFILRPFIIWMTRFDEQGQTMDEIHFFLILTSVLICSLLSEILGQNFLFGPLLLGLILPDGPPLSTEMEHKLQAVTNGLLLPCFCAFSGLNVNIFASETEDFHGMFKIIVVVTYIAKFIGVILPALCCGVTFSDALCLGLIMCCKGIIEVAMYVKLVDSKVLDVHSFNFLLVSLLIVTGFARPIVSYLYDPSKRYKTVSRRTIQGSNYHLQLRVLVCIYNEENVPMIINLLKACNPTRYNCITVFVLQLMKLSGRASAILMPHHQLDNLNLTAGYNSLHIVNAFERLEQEYTGSVLVQHFTAISPYKSMHTDICTVASDKRTTIIILPFHKRWGIDGRIGSVNSSIRRVNKHVMEWAPCSVGLFIDRGEMGINQTVLTSYSLYQIAMLFFGGDDDCEAIALSIRMAGHHQVKVTVILFKHEDYSYDEKEKDIEYLLENFADIECRERIHFEKVMVRHGEDTAKVMRSLRDAFDLAIVGRHSDPHSPIIMGLTEWNEDPAHLGVIGDILSSSDFRFSVLVVVQQPLKSEFKLSSSSKSLDSKVSSNFSKEDE